MLFVDHESARFRLASDGRRFPREFSKTYEEDAAPRKPEEEYYARRAREEYAEVVERQEPHRGRT